MIGVIVALVATLAVYSYEPKSPKVKDKGGHHHHHAHRM